jgi:hypothetical protein
MSTAELVKKLMDAGASSEVVAIAIQAVEEARNPPPRKHIRTRAPEGGKVVDIGR